MNRIRTILWAAAVALGAIVGVRWVVGPYSLFGIAVNAPLNPEGALGALVVGLLVARPRAHARDWGARWVWVVGMVGFIALWPALNVGFLSDDFILVDSARNFTVGSLGPLFTSAGGDGFFRPLGYLSLDLNAVVGGDARWWHLSAILIHSVNAGLVALLAARLGASALVALLAGALFAVHGTHLEAAVWIAGRFDLLACLFTLAALLLFGRSAVGALLCAWAAFWSKEAAFVLPALVMLLAWYEKRALRDSLPFWVVAGVAFLYRWLLLGGIGGYTGQSGESAFFSLKFGTTAKVLFARLWTSLFFPLNWSEEPALWIGVLACTYIAALLWLAWRATPGAGMRVALAGLMISILPPLHLLGGAADLSGGRLLYLPSVWFCLMLAFAVSGKARLILAGALFAFHVAAMQHNLPFWERAGQQVQAICEAAEPPKELPRAIQGVPALANGYDQCADR